MGKKVIDIYSKVYQTAKGTYYLKSPGVILLSKPDVGIHNLKGFLDGFDKKLGFGDYLKDKSILKSSEQISKIAGQACYASFGPKRTKNTEASKYFYNLISSGHGSVLEHANFSLFLYGISRSLTHELVRHRAGFGYSQLSQRYVSGRVLRFIEREEYQKDERLHKMFEKRIDRASEEYEKIAQILASKQEKNTDKLLSGETKTDLRKKVNQSARSVLPNETETWMVVTGNVRAWRHVISMRASEHAETEIRKLGYLIFKRLSVEAPILFADYSEVKYSDGTMGVKAEFPKV
jgi:thymidylate synthase (FAD)